MNAETLMITLDQVEELARNALINNGTSAANAAPVARSIRAAEAAGIRSHGLARLATYCEHARSGKVDGHAAPSVEPLAPAAFRADARTGFAHPAIEAGLPALSNAARAY